MTDAIIICVIVLVVGSAVTYIIRSKKKGVKCIGCPSGCHCNTKSGCASCTACSPKPHNEDK